MADTANPDAYGVIAAIFSQYGLQSLLPTIKAYMQQGITDQATLMLALRATPEYKQRFPAMDALNQKGRGFSEADYINYERNAAQTEEQYGFPKGFLTDPHRIAGMLEADVSASEVVDRAKINAAASLTAPQETKDALQRLYGLDQAGIAAYYFDPENSVPYLQKQYASATLSGEAARQQIDLDRANSERLALAGLTDTAATQAFGSVAQLGGLSTGAGETASQQTLIDAAFGDANAAAQVNRVQQGRVNQFQGAGGPQATQTGASGLGSSGTA